MGKMRTAMLWYPVRTLGYGERLGVWVQGCSRHCEGCISPTFRDANQGTLLTPEEILSRIPEHAIPDGLTVSGGEPFEQPEELLALVQLFRERYADGDILVFSGYTLAQLREMQCPAVSETLERISVLVDGAYHPEKNSGVGLRGSDNQQIHVFRHARRYADAENAPRRLQGVLMEDRLWLIGIPPGAE
ncbi:MAG: radical SAM protein [Oscillospiraceae bacterium]|nr:radical SAM protein [Oscillospiraceae bacterium]